MTDVPLTPVEKERMESRKISVVSYRWNQGEKKWRPVKKIVVSGKARAMSQMAKMCEGFL